MVNGEDEMDSGDVDGDAPDNHVRSHDKGSGNAHGSSSQKDKGKGVDRGISLPTKLVCFGL